ncbi:hypothetical protein [Clostridium perfringens]|uniref:hypothetical protein n=1 Tax=Clostridium perfringens TaxID=1502 RepID=UPI00096AB97D|nr:hypothetical protein [Clostridium perfringens]
MIITITKENLKNVENEIKDITDGRVVLEFTKDALMTMNYGYKKKFEDIFKRYKDIDFIVRIKH